MKTKILPFVSALLLSIILVSCSETNDDTDMAKIVFNLTDAPAVYDEVNIDIVGIQVIINDSIIDLDTETGIYNLLDFVNGKDTLLVDEAVPFGMLSQIRLILGDNNSLVIGEDTYDLQTPSAQQSGLKLNVHQEFLPGILYEYTIDFDASKSIVETGNGKYILKPVIKVFSDAVSGIIEGVVAPPDSRPVIYAISESDDTSSTYSDTLSGQFMFKGLSGGLYRVDFMPLAPYNDTTINDVLVESGYVTKLDTLKFQ